MAGSSKPEDSKDNKKKNESADSEQELENILGQLQETSGHPRAADNVDEKVDEVIRKPSGSASEDEGLGSILGQLEEKPDSTPVETMAPPLKKKIGFFQKLLNFFRR